MAITGIHPLCAALPEMAEATYRLLRADIQDHGQRVPISVHQGQVTNGRARLRACTELGLEPAVEEEFSDPDAADEEAVARRVISRHLRQEHWTAGQKAAAVLEVVHWYRERARLRQQAGVRLNSDAGEERGRAVELAAKEYGVSAATAYRLLQVREQDPALYEEVKDGERSVNSAFNTLVRQHRIPPPRTRKLNRKKKWKAADAVVHLPRPGDDTPTYLQTIMTDLAHHLHAGQLPDEMQFAQHYLEQADREEIEDLRDLRNFLEATVQICDHQLGTVDAPVIVEVTERVAPPLPPPPHDLLTRWLEDGQAIAVGNVPTVQEMVQRYLALTDQPPLLGLEMVHQRLGELIRALAAASTPPRPPIAP